MLVLTHHLFTQLADINSRRADLEPLGGRIVELSLQAVQHAANALQVINALQYQCAPDLKVMTMVYQAELQHTLRRHRRNVDPLDQSNPV